MKNGKVIKAIVPYELEAEVISKHDKVSMLDTPNYYIKQQQGFDYVDEGYMRHLLNLHYLPVKSYLPTLQLIHLLQNCKMVYWMSL